MSTVTPLPFDPTGAAPTNKVVNEQQVITAVNFRDYHYVIPNLAPFFSDTVVMTAKNPDGSNHPLTEGVDYYFSHCFISASRACAKPVYGSIEFLFSDFAGVLNLTYQSIGGNWTLDAATIAEILANSLTNPRTTAWEQIVELPVAFPVIDHEWDLVDMVGASEVVTALDEIRDAIGAGGQSGLAAHIADKTNPHDVTAAQVGLGNVQNYPIATTAQAQGGTNATTYMTPLLVAQAIQALGQTNLNAHLADFNNPHQTTATQIGLGNVPNYPMATSAQATAGTSTTTFMSPALVAQVVAIVNTALTNHVNNQLNPHNTTKTQILLSNVQNYPVATAQQAIDGSDDASYMTPLKTANAIASQSSSGLAAHLADYGNPHQVSKSQVGLGNVDNFLTATGADAINSAITDKFMTPQRTYASVMQFAGNGLLTHINDSGNPHNTTKAQVGLSLVDNFATASATDAINSSIANKFMTPQLTYAAIQQFVGTDFQAHVSNLNNPHDTTAAQLGLGSVQNYGVATQTDAQNGTSNVLYMTPLLTAQAISFQVGTAFAAHVAQTNPHHTTATDVGLGNVQNYPIADDTTAAAGTSTTTYLTPHGASLLVSGGALAAHIADHSNPHAVTKAQVGLGNVQNYAMATGAQATAGTDTASYLSPATGTTVAQVVLATHSTRTDNPHTVTATQVGLGLVQNYGVASTTQAQAGTDNQTYMTPALTAAAITSQVGTAFNSHVTNYNNPHQTTAAQVGAYTTQQVDALLAAQSSGHAVNYAPRGLLASRAHDSANTTGYSWAILGTLVAADPTAQDPSEYQGAAPDIVWYISGGEDPAQANGVTTMLRFSIRGTGTDPTSYYLTDLSPSLTTGGVDFGYTWDSAGKTATIYARMPNGSNQLTVTELNANAGSIAVSFLGYQSIPVVTMMTRTAGEAALQAQVNQLQSDLVNGLAALTAQINAM